MNIHVLNNKNTKEPILIRTSGLSICPKRAAAQVIQKHGSGIYDFSFVPLSFAFIECLAMWSVLSGCRVEFIGDRVDKNFYYKCINKYKAENNYDELQHIFPDPVYW